MTKYNDIGLWKNNDTIDNFGEELRQNSKFIYVSECMPMPCCSSFGCVNWFNDIYTLVGYVKYMVLNRIFSLILEAEEIFNESFDDLFNTALSKELIDENDVSHIKEVYGMIDKCFDVSSIEADTVIKNTIAAFNQYFSTFRGFDFKVIVFDSINELKPFVSNYYDKDITYNEDTIKQLFEDYATPEFEEMLMNITS